MRTSVADIREEDPIFLHHVIETVPDHLYLMASRTKDLDDFRDEYVNQQAVFHIADNRGRSHILDYFRGNKAY